VYSTTRRLLLVFVVLVSAVLIVIRVSPTQAQSIVLTLAVPSTNRQVLSGDVIANFQEANPGVSLNVVINDAVIPLATKGLGPHLDATQKYVSSADVVIVDSTHVTVEGTLAGYFLDLAPLIAADSQMNIPDFYPAVWRAFQWNGGTWALPVSADAYMLSYLPAAFDNAQIAYPSESWTIDDLVNAVRKLAVKDSAGQVTLPGIDVPGDLEKAFLFRSLLGTNIVDDTVSPNTPRLNDPNAEKLLDSWAKLQSEGLIGSGNGEPGPQSAPISVSYADDVLLQTGVSPDQKRVALLLPGGRGGLDVLGVAVSSGTLYPEQAYALARFLTNQVEFVSESSYIDSAAARISVAQLDAGLRENLPPELLNLVDRAYTDGIVASDLRYVDYLLSALTQVTTANVPAQSALAATGAQALTDMQTAVSKKPTTLVTVATPIPSVPLESGRIALKFGIRPSGDSIALLDQWYALASQFASTDPVVGQISIDQGSDTLTTSASKFDCFYLPYNGVADADLTKILNLSPLADSDPTFNRSDFIGNTLTQLTRDNKLWGLPIQIEPATLMYNDQLFRQAGISISNNEWTLNDFSNALAVLRTDPNAPPFVPFAQSQDGTSLLMLIAAYGGVPIDYRTTPPTIHFTDPTTVTAIQQVLDLVKQGYMQYHPFGPVNSEDNSPGPSLSTKLFADVLNLNSFLQGGTPVYKPVLYPRGTQFSGVSYSIGSAYISAKALSPEACYRWISTVSQHPELFDAMPARRSLISSPVLSASQGPEMVALYNQIDALTNDPNTIPIESQLGRKASPAAFLLQYWLFSAFDNYVLKGADLGAELNIAETATLGFQGCVAQLPPYDASNLASAQAYLRQFSDCATKIDPALQPYFVSLTG